MKVFVTGASGWVGSAVIADLIAAGYGVSGLVRSQEKARELERIGAEVVTGSLDDLDMLRRAAKAADAVMHTAFNHDFTKFAENAEQDRRAIEAIGSALEGSQRMLIVTSGVAHLAEGRLAVESDEPAPSFPRKSETAAASLRARGVRATSVRLASSVHGLGDHAFVPILIRIARETGVSAYPGDGTNRWAGVFRTDAARVYRLVLEAGATEDAYHAIADEGVPLRALAEVIGRRLGLPVESRPAEHFGWFAAFASADMAASSEHTRAALGWTPTGPGLLADVDQPGYFEV